MENDLFKYLTLLLKIFKNRPHHLAQYLIENNALDVKFIKKILNSNKLKELNDDNLEIYFTNISQMNDYFNSYTNDLKKEDKKSIEEITIELNNKLNDSLKNENYEKASEIRDYMTANNIKRK